jgi:hypothetical protein
MPTLDSGGEKLNVVLTKTLWKSLDTAAPGTAFEGEYVLANKSGTPHEDSPTFSFRVDENGVFEAKETNAAGEVTTYGYMELNAAVREAEAAGFIRKSAQPPAPSPHAEPEARLTSAPRPTRSGTIETPDRKAETRNARGFYTGQVNEVFHNPQFEKRRRKIISELHLPERIRALTTRTIEKAATSGTILQRSRSLSRAPGESVDLANPNLKELLQIRLLRTKKEKTDKEEIIPLEYYQAEKLAALIDLARNPDRTEDGEFWRAIREQGIEEIRIEVNSWLIESGDKARPQIVDIESIPVPKA